jgi:RimJ/RimL family protein N-acetyltransferase
VSADRIYQRWTARDGRPFTVRKARTSDAAQLIANTQRLLAEEPQWSVTEASEFCMTLGDEEAWIRGFQQRPHSLLLVADFGAPERAEIVGAVNFSTPARFRVRHRGRLGINVLAPYRGLGVGEALLRTLLTWATAEPELERVELSVFAHNQRALGLYRKLGFIEEARLRRAFKLADGAYYDDVMMVKWVK